jgi:hypothetical protein
LTPCSLFPFHSPLRRKENIRSPSTLLPHPLYTQPGSLNIGANRAVSPTHHGKDGSPSPSTFDALRRPFRALRALTLHLLHCNHCSRLVSSVQVFTTLPDRSVTSFVGNDLAQNMVYLDPGELSINHVRLSTPHYRRNRPQPASEVAPHLLSPP